MGLRGRLRRLERNASEDLSSFVLEDGSRYYFDPTSGELFIFGVECVRIQGTGKSWPETPETIKALAKARDRRAAFEQVPTGGLFPFDKDALIERGGAGTPLAEIRPDARRRRPRGPLRAMRATRMAPEGLRETSERSSMGGMREGRTG